MSKDEVADKQGESDADVDISESAPVVEQQSGDAPQEVLERLRPNCALADQNYNQIRGLISEIKAAESTLHGFHNKESGVTSEDVEAAKNDFHQAKKSYMELGNQINDGMKQVHASARTWHEDLLIQNIYKTYLAKLMASQETRNPLQNLVALIAEEGFELERMDSTLGGEVEPDEEAQKKSHDKEMEKCSQLILMLEARYQKRQLANRLRQGENPKKIINKLLYLAHQDPSDVNTFIWLANLYAGQLKGERNQNTRIEVRDQVLDFCKKAFSVIDDYLNVQRIESLNERDRMRAEYVKTITGIRKPLLEQAN